jgi:hypothetical protein
MATVYYTGARSWYGTPESEVPGFVPEVIRAYDEHGHQLLSIKAGRRFLPGEVLGYTKHGEPTAVSPCCRPWTWYPNACAIGNDRRIYCASASFDGSTYGGMDHAYDFFRVYRSNGGRLPFPQLHGAVIYDVALDSAGNIIVGGEEHYQDGAYLRKYDYDGTLLWSIAEVHTARYNDEK